MHKFLPVVVLLVLTVGLFTFSSVKRELMYKFNLDNDTTTSCCREDEISTSTGEFEEDASIAVFNNSKVSYPKTSLALGNITPGQTNVLGTTNTNGEEKWIEVSLSEQKVRAWEGNQVVMEFLISSGKWASTPTGDFRIWYKTRNQRMEGGSKTLGTYYNLPNVPHNMFFYKGYALHGAYWHNNFGEPMSHGCVNEPLNYAAQIFEWAGPILPSGINAIKATADNPGTRVFVH